MRSERCLVQCCDGPVPYHVARFFLDLVDFRQATVWKASYVVADQDNVAALLVVSDMRQDTKQQ